MALPRPLYGNNSVLHEIFGIEIFQCSQLGSPGGHEGVSWGQERMRKSTTGMQQLLCGLAHTVFPRLTPRLL